MIRSGPGAGLALSMFAAELASAMTCRPGLAAACEQAFAAAALAAAACLSGFVEMAQALSALIE